MSNVFVEEASLQDIANAIREKNGTATTYKPSEMGDAVRAIESGENVLEYARNVSFGNSVFPEGYELLLDFSNVYGNTITSLSSVFLKVAGLRKVTIIGKADDNLNMYGAFQSSSLEEIDLSGLEAIPKKIHYLFYASQKLKNVYGELDLSNVESITYSFLGIPLLEEIRFKNNSIKLSISFYNSSLLSSDSINSIIDGLADLTGADTQTLTFHATVKAKLTEAQLTTITAKNWTLA